MYACPNCGSNLRFSIEKQALFCDACDTVKSPYDVVKDHDADESNVFEATVFTCPQCGGEIISEDNEAAAFCSYCGGSTILTGRINSVMTPQYIIPFSKNKQDCVNSYKQKVKKAVFAPDSVKNVKNIDSFRGIYMPYWNYTTALSKRISTEVTTVRYSGNYKYTDHYDLSADVTSDYSGIYFDAASSFADDLNNAISPYDYDKQLKFTPSFLSGFYADVTDVPAITYGDDVQSLVAVNSERAIENMEPFKKYSGDVSSKSRSRLEKELRPDIVGCDMVMLPVWFMSTKVKVNGEDRVSYSVINGQTGAIAGDIPVDLKKYFIAAGLSSLLLFVILQILAGVFDIVPNPKVVLVISAVFSIIVSAIHGSRNKAIAAHESHLDDKGYIVREWIEIEKNQGADLGTAISKGVESGTRMMDYEKNHLRYKKTGRIFGWITSIGAAALLVVNPIRDLIWYIGILVILGSSVVQILMMMINFNELTSRPMPQFKRTGGDDSAKNLE